jgi:pimeloyl-ACP methyl ester carboxylesterase
MAHHQASQSIQQLLTTPLDILERQIADGELSDQLREVLGPGPAAELEDMTRAGRPAVLAPEERPLVVVLPGITGSSLMNISGDVGLIWLNPLALLAGKLALLRLDPSGQRDQAAGVRIVPSGLLPTHYLLIQIHLRMLGGCDVLGFPFDWRRSLEPAVEELGRLVFEQFRQTGRKVHLVGHSMGGLVARDLCLRYPSEAAQSVAQVIQLGSPNYGSYEAVRNLITGGSLADLVAKLNPANAPLAQMRTFPGLYILLPAPVEAYPPAAPQSYPYAGGPDIYDPAVYASADIGTPHLQASRALYDWLAHVGEPPVPISVIAGYDLPTCVGAVVRSIDGGAPVFDFAAHVSPDGDGTVPLASVTALPGATRFYGRGLKHGDLPLYRVVRESVIDLVHGRQPSGLETAPRTATLGVEPAPIETIAPTTAVPLTLGEIELEFIAERIRSGQTTPEDLRVLSGLI